MVSPTETAELIEMRFSMWTPGGPKKALLDMGPHWRNLANTIEPCVRGSDAALRQITLTTCIFALCGPA